MTSETLLLFVSRIRKLTSRIRAYELRSADGNELPIVTAGSHLTIPVVIHGKADFRHYAICSNPNQRDFYEIAVLHEATGRGGSQFIRDTFGIDTQFKCAAPTNNFHVHANSSPAILIAGGIGIAPIMSIAYTLAARGRRFSLHYAGRSKAEMAFADELQHNFPHQIHFYSAAEKQRLDIGHLMADASSNTQFYCCGPQKMLDEIEASAKNLGIDKDRIQQEHFTAEIHEHDKPVVLELAYSNKLIKVNGDQPLLAALRDAKLPVKFDCCVGDCGTCAVKILEGEADHRDHVLSDEQKAQGFICVCVSRSKTEKLVLAI
ncbi:MAG: PDR/VanB family oxidoreductase [Cellvibrio sp.]